MIQLVFATNNQHKIKEIRKVLGDLNFSDTTDKIEILSLDDIQCREDIPETQETIEGNASQKSFYIFDYYKHNCFADDTGLEVEVLNGRPGVYSARYAGPEKDPDKNMDKVLEELDSKSNRKARFKTVISLIIEGKEYLFEGIVNGVILNDKRGEMGFGYDPIFLVPDLGKTFAQMSAEEKNIISHRGKAFRQLKNLLGEDRRQTTDDR